MARHSDTDMSAIYYATKFSGVCFGALRPKRENRLALRLPHYCLYPFHYLSSQRLSQLAQCELSPSSVGCAYVEVPRNFPRRRPLQRREEVKMAGGPPRSVSSLEAASIGEPEGPAYRGAKSAARFDIVQGHFRGFSHYAQKCLERSFSSSHFRRLRVLLATNCRVCHGPDK